MLRMATDLTRAHARGVGRANDCAHRSSSDDSGLDPELVKSLEHPNARKPARTACPERKCDRGLCVADVSGAAHQGNSCSAESAWQPSRGEVGLGCPVRSAASMQSRPVVVSPQLRPPLLLSGTVQAETLWHCAGRER